MVYIVIGILVLIVVVMAIVDSKRKKVVKRTIKPEGNKYEWNICPHCHLAYIPYRKNQVYCSFWCEFLEHTKG